MTTANPQLEASVQPPPKEKEVVTLASLSPDKESPAEILKIPLNEIRPMLYQPRTYVDLEKVRELSESISALGQQQAGKVRPIDPPDEKGHRFELISGERRYRACLMANTGFFRAEIDRTPMTPAQQFVKALTSNSDMEPLSPTENALAIQRLKAMELSDADICKVMSRSPAWVSQHYSLLKLSRRVFAMMGPEVPEENRLGSGLGLLLLGVPEDYQIALAKEIVERKLSMVKARHLITVTLSQRGIKTKARRPGREFQIFSNFIQRTGEQLKTFIDTPRPLLREILADAGSLQERMRVLEILEQIAVDFPEFNEEVQSILKRSDADRIRDRLSTIERVKSLAQDFPKLKEMIETVLRERLPG